MRSTTFANPAIVSTISNLRQHVSDAKRNGLTTGFVPTMGALHAGHFQLMKTARRECGLVVVSIFVNPLQFDRPDDLARYPRTIEADAALCQSAGIHLIFAPTAAELYPQEQKTFVDLPSLAGGLCGRFRPGHFQGVATVVMKLFGIVQPDRAYFGQKDAQQLALIQRMVIDLNVPVQIVAVSTVREPDGLALSSRNQQLSAAERQTAPRLYRALRFASELIAAGERTVAVVNDKARGHLGQYPDFRVEYFEIVHPLTLQPITYVSGPVLIAAAAWLGATRLIDNILVEPSPT